VSCVLSTQIPQHISLLLNKTRPTHWKTFKKEKEEEKGEGEGESVNNIQKELCNCWQLNVMV